MSEQVPPLTEGEAAAELDMPRTTLRYWRVNGHLSEGMLTANQPPRGALYDANALAAVLNGVKELLQKTENPPLEASSGGLEPPRKGLAGIVAEGVHQSWN